MYHSADNTWYEGVVDKICRKIVQIYYESDDSYTQHSKIDDNIQQIGNLGDENDDDSDDDEPLSLVLKKK